MTKLKKYDIEGKEVEEVEFDDKLLEGKGSPQSIKDYLVAIRNNARQWSANTKGRSEINHSNAKPHPQKGTGRARQGTIKATQYKGGATVFGPKPKSNQHVRINRKERRAAIRTLIGQKVSGGNLHLLKLGSIDGPKTKRVANFLEKVGLKGKKILFLSDESEAAKNDRQNFYLSMRNIPNAHFMPVRSVSGYDVIKNQEVIVVDSAYDQLIESMRS